ncbi:MAG: hypothetical protein AAF927_20880 [Bacteroidota bacterium]
MSILFFVFVNFPFVLIFDKPAAILGIPVLPFALLTSWLVWIIILAFLLERKS